MFSLESKFSWLIPCLETFLKRSLVRLDWLSKWTVVLSLLFWWNDTTTWGAVHNSLHFHSSTRSIFFTNHSLLSKSTVIQKNMIVRHARDNGDNYGCPLVHCLLVPVLNTSVVEYHNEFIELPVHDKPW